MTWFEIRHIMREDGSPYLDRYGIRPQSKIVDGKKRSADNGYRVFLHHFMATDDDGHHNHPWRWAFGIVLWGGYEEERLDTATGKIETRWVTGINWLTERTYHRIVGLRDRTWTLFVTGPRIGSWGFWIPGRGHVNWKTRLRERGFDV